MPLNPTANEFMIPRDEDTVRRVEDFYEEIGWVVRQPADSPFDRVVSLALRGVELPLGEGRDNVPRFSYWQTENPEKVYRFTDNFEPRPSIFSLGLHLPSRQDLNEFCVFTGSDEVVDDLYDAGGVTLNAHVYEYRNHVGRREMRFEDPFGYTIRVTTHPDLVRG
jgi:hypothetical protein